MWKIKMTHIKSGEVIVSSFTFEKRKEAAAHIAALGYMPNVSVEIIKEEYWSDERKDKWSGIISRSKESRSRMKDQHPVVLYVDFVARKMVKSVPVLQIAEMFEETKLEIGEVCNLCKNHLEDCNCPKEVV